MTTNAYITFRDSLRDEENKFITENIFFAFDNKQFEEWLKKIWVETIKDIISIGAGGYLRRDKTDEYHELFTRTSEKMKNWLNASPENLFSALVYELDNHEYELTRDHSDTLEALGLTAEELTTEQWDILKKAKTKSHIME